MTEVARPGPDPEPAGSAEGTGSLRDGRRVMVRRLVADDRERLEEFLTRLSDISISVRFFAPLPRSTALLELLEGLDSPDRFSLLALLVEGGEEQLIGHAECARDGPNTTSAEVAFLVADAYQGRGCATLLLRRLAREARRRGIREFHASVLMENNAMLEVFRGSGYPLEEWWGPDAVQARLSILVPPPSTASPAVSEGRPQGAPG